LKELDKISLVETSAVKCDLMNRLTTDRAVKMVWKRKLSGEIVSKIMLWLSWILTRCWMRISMITPRPRNQIIGITVNVDWKNCFNEKLLMNDGHWVSFFQERKIFEVEYFYFD
jgi:hypothetical protein